MLELTCIYSPVRPSGRKTKIIAGMEREGYVKSDGTGKGLRRGEHGKGRGGELRPLPSRGTGGRKGNGAGNSGLRKGREGGEEREGGRGKGM